VKKASVDIWFDFANPPHVNLFRPIFYHYSDFGSTFYCTAKNFAETIGLLDKYQIDYHLFGKHAGRNRFRKVMALLSRNLEMIANIPNFRICICSSFEAVQISWLKRRTSVMFDDNEIAPNWLYAKFVSHVITPSVIDKKLFVRNGIAERKIIRYNGFKEDIYLADYEPDPAFLKIMPFCDFVTVRPENIYASYVSKNASSITGDLIQALLNSGYKILYLPRYEIDYSYVDKKNTNIFIPSSPLNGLDVCYYSQAVLTGAGTFAREAALLGTPAVSFFAGETLLSVDQALIKENKMYYSRDIRSILSFLRNTRKREFNQNKSRAVQQQVFSLIDDILYKC